MKKILTLSAVALLIIAAMLALSSCGRLTVSDVTEDPDAVLLEALDKSVSEFFTDDIGIGDIIEDALSSGSASIYI